jgi:hypothetical protein
MMLRKKILGLFGITMAVLMTGCGQSEKLSVEEANVVVKSKVIVQVGNTSDSLPHAATDTSGVTIINTPSATIKLDLSNFKGNPLTISNGAMTNLGSAYITDLFDNNLKVCGPSGNQKCTKAFIRLYTTGAAGAGVYNSDIEYGAPLYGGLANFTATGSGLSLIGLGPENAAISQMYIIPSNRFIVTLANFAGTTAVPLIYQFVADFSDAGAGTYRTTLVIEYGLAL